MADPQISELRKRLEDLPPQLHSSPRFLLWKYLPVEGKKPRKIPYYANGRPRGGTKTDPIPLDTPDDLKHLVALPRALEAMDRLEMDGVGMAVVGDGIAAFDLDDCLKNGKLDPSHPGASLAQDAELLGAYMEISPSGQGLRILGSSKVLEAYSKGGLEYWGKGRYVTLTGVVYANKRGWADLTTLRTPLRVHDPSTTADEGGLVTRKVLAELKSALSSMSSDERDLWVRMGHALKALGQRGQDLWMEWSATSPKFEENDALRVWDSLNPSSTGYRAVFAEAQRNWKWENPRTKKAHMDQDPQFPDDEDEPDSILGRSIDLGDHDLYPTEFILDGFLPVGVTLVAGAWGAGKSTNLIPLFASVGHLTPEDWNFHPALRRHVIWITEAPDQARDTLYSLACSKGSAPWGDIKEWFHLLPARRTDPKILAKAIKKAIPQLTYENDNGFSVSPVVVLDTTSANLDLENESDNSEVGAAIAALKERLPKVSIVLIGHTPKALVKADVADMTFRGAGAWEADSVAVYYLVHDQETDMRYMAIRKCRFTPDYTEVSFGQEGGRELVDTPWGEPQSKGYLHGVPQRSDGTERKEAKKEAAQERREAAKEHRLTDRQSAIYNLVGKLTEQRTPITPAVLREHLGGKNELLIEATNRLVEAGALQRVLIPPDIKQFWGLHKKITEVLLPEGVSPEVYFDSIRSNIEGDLL